MDLVRSTHPIDETFDAAFSALFDRASEFDGYGYVGGDTRDAEQLAIRVRSEWVADGAAGLSKEERRAALFTECRMLRFSGYPHPSVCSVTSWPLRHPSTVPSLTLGCRLLERILPGPFPPTARKCTPTTGSPIPHIN